MRRNEALPRLIHHIIIVSVMLDEALPHLYIL
jgi:hypothetical protein